MSIIFEAAYDKNDIGYAFSVKTLDGLSKLIGLDFKEREVWLMEPSDLIEKCSSSLSFISVLRTMESFEDQFLLELSAADLRPSLEGVREVAKRALREQVKVGVRPA